MDDEATKAQIKPRVVRRDGVSAAPANELFQPVTRPEKSDLAAWTGHFPSAGLDVCGRFAALGRQSLELLLTLDSKTIGLSSVRPTIGTHLTVSSSSTYGYHHLVVSQCRVTH